MRRARLLTLIGSVALHAAAVAAVLLVVASVREPEPLFVDLTSGAQAGDERPAARGPASAARPSSGRTGSGHASVPAAPAPSRAVEVSPVPAPPAPAPSPALSPDSLPREPAAPREVAPSTRETVAAEPVRPATESGADSGRSPSGVTPNAGTGSVASDAPSAAGGGTASGGGSGGSRVALAGPGTGRSEVPPEFGPYLARFRQRIQEQVVYPLAARRRGIAGRVEVDVLLEPTGRVRDVTITGSSSHAMLDEAAVEAVRSITPIPLPDGLPKRPLRVRLPIVFDLQ